MSGEDQSGRWGEYVATLEVNLKPSPSLEVELGLHLHGRPLYIITKNFSRWRRYEHLIVQTFGIEADQFGINSQATPYRLSDGTLWIKSLRDRVRCRGARVYGQIDWKDERGECSVHHFDLEHGSPNDLKPAWDALRSFSNIQPAKPGPKVGTAWNQKYKTPEEWHAAIREKVLTKNNRGIADGRIIAGWLGTSTTTMYRHMKRWGPKTLEELRNGKF